jgi:hypothetical protein
LVGEKVGVMHAVIGRVEIHPGHEDETRRMIEDGGIEMLRHMEGSLGGYWARGDADNIQHSFWLFDTEEHARIAHTTFSGLREMPNAPATLVSVEVCEVIGQA